MPELYILGLGCIFYSVYITLKCANMRSVESDPQKMFKMMNRSSIVGGIGSLAFIYDGILTSSFLSIGINTFALIINIYFFKQRNSR
jgi:hypothetical protein